MNEYLVYFRIRRGGTGIPYELARAEFLSVFPEAEIRKERSERHRLWVDLPAAPGALARRASLLGYTEAAIHRRTEPYRGETLIPIGRGRWNIGWCREGDRKVYQTEAYVQDAEAFLDLSPDRRPFEILEDGESQIAIGHRAYRAMSPLDACFLLNISGATPSDTILDPFAGFGGILTEAARRRLRMFASDVDRSLSPGLAALQPGRCTVADIRCLPISPAGIDLIVTEPPFRPEYRDAVTAALPELLRVLRPSGRAIVLVKSDMADPIAASCRHLGGTVDTLAVIPRSGGMQCPVLKITLGS